jgi:hypothetical protein
MSFTALEPEDVARLHADAHPGYELASYGEIGLPFFEIKFQAQILDHKPIDPFAEFVLRASASGINDSSEMQQLLGLNRRVLDTTLVGLIAKDLLHLAPGAEEVRITPAGEKLLADAVQIEPESVQLRIVFDPMLRDVIEPFGDYLQPRDLRDLGIKEIGLPKKLVPELHQIDLRDVERVLRQIGGGREQTSNILTLRSMRRFRVYRQAVALIFRADGATDVVVDVALDGQISERHSRALAELGLKRKLGLGSAGQSPSTQLVEIQAPDLSRIASDEQLRRDVRALKRTIRASEVADLAPEQVAPARMAELKARAEQAQAALGKAEVVPVETYEHPGYLADALQHSSERLVVVSPWLRRAVMDDEFISRVTEALERGVSVHIGWGISQDEASEPNADKSVLRRLEELSRRYPGLNVRRLGGVHAKILISDSRYVIVTSFNWLSFRGDPSRTFRDERGTLISRAEYVDDQAESWIDRLTSLPRTPS